MDTNGVQRLEEYFRRIGDVLGEESRRGSFAIYAMRLLGDGERKSLEPIAARSCPDPSKADAMHQRLLYFAVNSRWSDRDVRREAAQRDGRRSSPLHHAHEDLGLIRRRLDEHAPWRCGAGARCSRCPLRSGHAPTSTIASRMGT
nr:transposase [Cystobacter fuscus]